MFMMRPGDAIRGILVGPCYAILGEGEANDNNGYNGMPLEEWLNFPLRLRSMWRKMTTRAYRSCDGIMKLEVLIRNLARNR